MKKVIDIQEKRIEKIAEKKVDNMFAGINGIIESQADHLINLGINGTLQDFVVMYPINPSVVHCIIEKLTKD